MDDSTKAIAALTDIASSLDAIARAIHGHSDYLVNGEEGRGGIDIMSLQIRDGLSAHAEAVQNAGADIRAGLEALALAITNNKDGESL